MQAVVAEEFGAPDVVVVQQVPDQPPGPGQVLIKVAAAAVNPVDLVTRQGGLHGAGLHAGPPLRLGWDVAGQVDQIGPGVRRLRAGQRVIGLSDRLDAQSKAHAESVVLDEDHVAAVPAELDLHRVALLPLAGSTALQALRRSGLGRGGSLLVTGAAGAVGSILVQLALLEGIHVYGAGRLHQRPAIERLGAHFVDTADLASNVRSTVDGGVDAAVDCAVLDITSLDAVRNGGVHVALVVGGGPPSLRGIHSTSIAVCADWKELTFLAALAATGGLELPTPRAIPLAAAADAYRALEKDRSTRLVLTP